MRGVSVAVCYDQQVNRAHKLWHYQRSGLGHPCVLLLNVIVAGRPLGRYFLVRNQDQSQGAGDVGRSAIGGRRGGHEERRRMGRKQRLMDTGGEG